MTIKNKSQTKFGKRHSLTIKMIDDIDHHILRLLQEDARLSNAAIGEQVGLNASSVYERVKKLERKGI